MSTFIWYDLMTTDMGAAEAFYRKVVGWDAQDTGSSDMRYTQFMAGGQMVAGLMDLPAEACDAGAQPCWTGYIHTDDVDATAKAIKAAGGLIHREPADIPDVGRFAAVADPQGTAFNLFKPNGAGDKPADPMMPGHIGWHELYAIDWEKAFTFYAALFGWEKAEAMDMGPMGTYQLFTAAGSRDAMGGMMNSPEGVPGPFWLFYFIVDAIDAAAARVAEQGGKVIAGPMAVPGDSWIIQCIDPQGAMFALVASRR